jgi:hypothetical protein
MGADGLEGLVALAVDGLTRTTAKNSWSSQCARVPALGSSEGTRFVTVRVGWMGTLQPYASRPGARPLSDLADEAYALGGGHGIALRSGEIVAVVRLLRGTASETRALARRVADRLRQQP